MKEGHLATCEMPFGLKTVWSAAVGSLLLPEWWLVERVVPVASRRRRTDGADERENATGVDDGDAAQHFARDGDQEDRRTGRGDGGKVVEQLAKRWTETTPRSSEEIDDDFAELVAYLVLGHRASQTTAIRTPAAADAMPLRKGSEERTRETNDGVVSTTDI